MRACPRHLLIFYANLCKRDEIILISIAATKLSPEILQLNEIRINLNAFCDLEHQQRVHQWGWNGVDPGYHDDGWWMNEFVMYDRIMDCCGKVRFLLFNCFHLWIWMDCWIRYSYHLTLSTRYTCDNDNWTIEQAPLPPRYPLLASRNLSSSSVVFLRYIRPRATCGILCVWECGREWHFGQKTMKLW